MKHKTRISAPNGLAAAAILIAAFGFVGVGSTAGAASMSQASPHASPWVEVADSSRIRIVRGATRPTGVIEAGIQIQLDPGWKTYWRYPGDAGVPPQFDWSASNNVAAIDVLWPVPEHFRDDYGDNIGYHDEVVFPLVITPEVDGRPVNLDMTVYFAVCKDICIPARADLALAFGEQTSTPRYAFLIAQFVDATPKPPEDVEGLAVAAVEPLATDAGVASS